jgi:tetratricopeptide (TPR) repeat protein
MDRQVEGNGRGSSAERAAMLGEARDHRRAGRAQSAEEIYRRLIGDWPADPEPRHGLGVICAQTGRLAAAIAHFTEAARLAPGHPVVLNHLGQACLAAGRVDDAAHAFRQAIAAHPQQAEAHYNLGALLRQQGDLGAAADCFRRAIAANPAAPHAHIDLGVTLQQMAKMTEAVAAFRQAIAVDPGSFEAHYNLAGALAAARDPEAAIEAYRAAIRLNPREPWAEVNLGVVLQGLDRHTEAIRHFERAIALAPDHAGAHLGLGGARYERGDHAGAAAALRRAIELDPENPGPYVNLAQALQDAGDLAGAEAAYHRALEIEPGFVLAQAHLSILLQRLGKLADARTLLDYPRLLKRRTIEAVEGWPSLSAFNGDLARAIYAHPTLLRDPPGKATTKGSQTAEILDAADGPIAALRALIERSATDYLAEIPAAAPGLFAAPPSEWLLHGWGVVLRSSGFQTAHFHPGGIVSGVYYVQVPATVQDSTAGEAGFIRFGQPGTRATAPPEVDLILSVKPVEGLMILFPSYFWHNTIPFESTQDRICVAFDVLPRTAPRTGA